jgi:hypothetical protein
LALTISGALFQNLAFRKVSEVLYGKGFTSEDVHAAISGVQSNIFSQVTPDISHSMIMAIVLALSNVYIFVFVAGSVCIVASLCLKWEEMEMEVTVQD